MAYLKSPTLFFNMLPKIPWKMIPEIQLLTDNFTGMKWNHETQIKYAEVLSQDKHFDGTGAKNNKALLARDRINRAPKGLGFVDLKPEIQLTEAGKKLLSRRKKEEVLLRQLLKFQLPSPYHKEPERLEGKFYIKPYLEMFRLLYELGTVSFDELMMFGMQITHYEKFYQVVADIYQFRRLKEYTTESYKDFMVLYLRKEIEKIFRYDVSEGKDRPTEERIRVFEEFVNKKASSMRDYAEACVRYLYATGLVGISRRDHSLYIMPKKKKEVEYFLKNVDRSPVFIDDEVKYKEYLFDASTPVLYSDVKG